MGLHVACGCIWVQFNGTGNGVQTKHFGRIEYAGCPFTKDVCLSAKAVNALNAGPPQYLADDVCKWHDCFLTR